MKKIIGLMALLTFSLNAFAVPVDASSLTMNVYQIAVALDADCSNPQVIFQSTAGTLKDFLANPTLGSGNLADGTYNCIMITMDDVISFKPSANEGANCVMGATYQIDVCRAPSTTDLLTGTTTTNPICAGTDQTVSAGGVANKVTLYLLTGTSGAANSAFQKGVGANNGIALASPFIVAGAETGIFYLDATGQVQSQNGHCEMNAPQFGFR